MQDLRESSLFDGDNASYLEPLYEQYLTDPSSIDPSLRAKFDALGPKSATEVPHLPIQQAFLDYVKHKHVEAVSEPALEQKQMQVQLLIDAYRCCGHQHAQLDPLQLQKHHKHLPELTLEYHGLSQADLSSVFQSSLVDYPQASLADIIKRLEKIYCGTVGSEYMHVANEEERDWLMQRLETSLPALQFSNDKAKNILSLLNKAEGLEKYLHTKYVGQKRFSLRRWREFNSCHGRIDSARWISGHKKEVVIGMAHRGRLNVLVNL